MNRLLLSTAPAALAAFGLLSTTSAQGFPTVNAVVSNSTGDEVIEISLTNPTTSNPTGLRYAVIVAYVSVENTNSDWPNLARTITPNIERVDLTNHEDGWTEGMTGIDATAPNGLNDSFSIPPSYVVTMASEVGAAPYTDYAVGFDQNMLWPTAEWPTEGGSSLEWGKAVKNENFDLEQVIRGALAIQSGKERSSKEVNSLIAMIEKEKAQFMLHLAIAEIQPGSTPTVPIIRISHTKDVVIALSTTGTEDAYFRYDPRTEEEILEEVTMPYFYPSSYGHYIDIELDSVPLENSFYLLALPKYGGGFYGLNVTRSPGPWQDNGLRAFIPHMAPPLTTAAAGILYSGTSNLAGLTGAGPAFVDTFYYYHIEDPLP